MKFYGFTLLSVIGYGYYIIIRRMSMKSQICMAIVRALGQGNQPLKYCSAVKRVLKICNMQTWNSP